jgi:hypothetical protein
MLPALHGGVIGGFMELTAVIQLSIAQPATDAPQARSTSPWSISAPGARDTYARAEVKKVGRRIANVAGGGLAGQPRLADRRPAGPLLVGEPET